MADYQNIFTQVQVRGAAPDFGVPVPGMKTVGSRASSIPSGKFGNAQIGPIYLGNLGVLSLIFGFIAFEIIGLNMWASVNWDPIQFVRQLPWLALEPPKPEYGLKIFPPLNEGGWWLIAGFFLTASLLLWWARTYRRARALGLGHAYRLGVRLGDLALSGSGLYPPAFDGALERSGSLRHLPAPRLDRNFSIRYGNLFYSPFHMLSITFLYGSTLLFAMHGATILAVSRFGGEREIEQISIEVRPLSGRRCFGAGRWASTPRWSPSIAGLGGSRCSRR